MPCPSMTPEAIQYRRFRVADLTRQGYSCSRIAEILGITPRSVTRLRTRIGENLGKAARPYTPEEISLIEALLDDDCSYEEIGRTLDRDPAHIHRRWPHRSWTRSESAKHARMLDRLGGVLR